MLAFTNQKKIIELIEAVHCRVLFLPPYSPEFNPIEHFWAHVKNAIRKAAETITDFYEAAIHALGDLCAN